MKQILAIAMIGVTLMWPFSKASAAAPAGSAYDYQFKTLIGNHPLPLSQFKGKAILIVNTASQCGFTPQYEGLQKLYDTYKDRGLVIIGVPSNDFGGQEPGSAEEIATQCKKNYGVTFPMAAKEVVKGENAHPFYAWAEANPNMGAPKWNFHKYLVNSEGMLVDYFSSITSPEKGSLIKAIEAALPKPQAN